MKRTIKVLSLAMVAFMISGCNTGKFNGEVKWQEFSFKESQALNEMERYTAIQKATLAIDDYSVINFVEKQYQNTGLQESSFETTGKMTAYSNDFVKWEENTEEKDIVSNITRTRKINNKSQAVQLKYQISETEEEQVILTHHVNNESGLSLGRNYSDTTVYAYARNDLSINYPSTSSNFYKVSSGIIGVESYINESYSYIPYEKEIKELHIIQREQLVWKLDKQSRLVSYTSYEETLSNRYGNGEWAKKLVRISCDTTSVGFTYGKRKEGKTNEIMAAFENPFFTNKVTPEIGTYKVDGESTTPTPVSVSVTKKTDYQLVASNKYHVENTYAVTFTESFNAINFSIYAAKFDDYKDKDPEQTILYVRNAEMPGFVAAETTDLGTVFILDGPITTVGLSVEYDLSIDSEANIVMSNVKTLVNM